METLNKEERRVFTKNCTELIDWVKLYGLPSPASCLIPEFTMAARLRGIKARAVLRNEAEIIDTENILKLKN